MKETASIIRKKSLLLSGILLMIFLFSFSVMAEGAQSTAGTATQKTTPATSKRMTGLEAKLKKQIKGYRGTWTIYVRNLKTDNYVLINNQSMYAASLVKLYAMAACYEKIRKGKIREASVSSTLRKMITVSDNYSYNSIVKKVGVNYIDDWAKNHGYAKTTIRRGSYYASNYAGTISKRGGTNKTSVKDVGKLLESIYRKKCVSKTASTKMMSLLAKQDRRTKIPAGIPRGIKVLNKTGETDDYTHDAAIVYAPKAPYVIVVMAKCPGYAWNAASNISRISKTVYQYMN